MYAPWAIHLLSQNISNADVHQVELLREHLALGSLAGARPAEHADDYGHLQTARVRVWTLVWIHVV